MKRTRQTTKNHLRAPRHARVRARVMGTAQVPRLSVWRGLKSIRLQLVDDVNRKTLCDAHSREIKKVDVKDKTAKVAKAYEVGKLLAEKAKAKKITGVVFDRGGYKYHGRVAAAAEGARENGLKF